MSSKHRTSSTSGIVRGPTKPRRKRIPTIQLRLPIYWASALINGDYSGIEPEDEQQIEAMMADLISQYESVHAVGVGEADFCSHHDGMRWGALAGDCATYTFHVGAKRNAKTRPGDRMPCVGRDVPHRRGDPAWVVHVHSASGSVMFWYFKTEEQARRCATRTSVNRDGSRAEARYAEKVYADTVIDWGKGGKPKAAKSAGDASSALKTKERPESDAKRRERSVLAIIDVNAEDFAAGSSHPWGLGAPFYDKAEKQALLRLEKRGIVVITKTKDKVAGIPEWHAKRKSKSVHPIVSRHQASMQVPFSKMEQLATDSVLKPLATKYGVNLWSSGTDEAIYNRFVYAKASDDDVRTVAFRLEELSKLTK